MSVTTTDPIADMLARIRNAIAVSKHEIDLPHSKVKEAVAKLLAENSFVESVTTDGKGINKTLHISIFKPHTNAKITEIKRISTPGRRQYVSADAIPIVKRGRGIVIISTSKGMMTGIKAKTSGIGGELICQVY
ncbi:MAG: 30S ribosomal protein S8 [Patescibacteria group bacterium]|jgi:small subunit ribosomal protein S8